VSDLVDNKAEPPEQGHYVPRRTDRTPGRRKRWVNGIAFFLILAIGVGVMSVLIRTKPELAPVGRQETVYSVNTQEAVFDDNRPELVVFGEIAAGHETDLRGLVGGDIVSISPNFRNGGAVRNGEALIVIDPFEYEAAIAETTARIDESNARIRSETVSLKSDKEVWSLREQDAKRFQRLHKKGSVSDKSRDQAMMELSLQTQTVARREAAILTERAKLEQQKVALMRAERDLKRTVLRAPYDGFLSQVSVQRGSLVNSNDRIAHLVGSGAFEARGHMSDAQYGRLLQDGGLEGRPAKVRWKVGNESIDYEAVVARITASIDAGTGGVTFYALLDAEGIDLPIRPGAFVEISLPDRYFPNSARLPAVAVHDDSRVFVLEDGRLASRAVKVLGREGDDVIVEGRLEPGERVVLTRFTEMAPGVRALDPALSADGPDTNAVAEPTTGR
jgi:multidrug efflux system membrane fusion protein